MYYTMNMSLFILQNQNKDNEYSTIDQSLIKQQETITRLEAAIKEKDAIIQEK